MYNIALDIKKNKNKYIIFLVITIACILMGVTDTFIKPGYFLKSVCKIILFLIMPIIFYFIKNKDNFKNLFISQKFKIWPIIAGLGVYAGILVLYFLTNSFIDYSGITGTLQNDLGINNNNFVFVALYISFMNSLLEEFFFRGFGFLTLKKYVSKKVAYLFSSIMFALYHVAIIIGWFELYVSALIIIGLMIVGIIFSYIDDKTNSIYMSWCVHMFANFAINTIGFMLFGII